MEKNDGPKSPTKTQIPQIYFISRNPAQKQKIQIPKQRTNLSKKMKKKYHIPTQSENKTQEINNTLKFRYCEKAIEFEKT